MLDLWTFVVGDKTYTSTSRHQLKNKRKAMRSNPTCNDTDPSRIRPIRINTELGEAYMPIIYSAHIKNKRRKDASEEHS